MTNPIAAVSLTKTQEIRASPHRALDLLEIMVPLYRLKETKKHPSTVKQPSTATNAAFEPRCAPPVPAAGKRKAAAVVEPAKRGPGRPPASSAPKRGRPRNTVTGSAAAAEAREAREAREAAAEEEDVSRRATAQRARARTRTRGGTHSATPPPRARAMTQRPTWSESLTCS